MIVYVYCELKLISNRVTIVFSVVCDDVTADEFPHPSPGSRIVTRFEQDDLVQQVMLDRVDLPALDGRQRFLELRGQMSDVRRTERRTVLLVQQRDVGVREILGGRQDEELVPAVPEQFELKRSAMSTRSGGGGGGGSARITWSTNGRVISAGKLLTVDTATKIEAAVSYTACVSLTVLTNLGTTDICGNNR